MAIPRFDFDSQRIKLHCLYDNLEEKEFTESSLESSKIREVYGKLLFSKIPDDRPLTFGSYVMSVDGKIAFEDNEVGPLIAQKNLLDQDGALADFWVLNLLRASCDAILIGSGTLIKEPDYSGSAYDPDLITARKNAGKPIAPWTIVVTSTGKNIPFGNAVFQSPEIPMMIATSPNGYDNLQKEIAKDYFLVPEIHSDQDGESIKKLLKENQGKIAVLVTGEGSNTNIGEMMSVLRALDIEKVLVESPTFCHHLMQQGLLDEMFLNTSCVFVGGQATGIGTTGKAFASTDHPHCKMVSLHMHSPHFLYMRYKMIYGLK